MSGKIAGAVWDMKLPIAEKYVLLALADHADHEGYGIRPSYDLVSWKTGYTRRYVMKLVGKLEAKGILILDKPGGFSEPGKVNSANEWHIDVEKAPRTPKRRRGVVSRGTPGGSVPRDTRVVSPSSPQPSYETSVLEPSVPTERVDGAKPEPKTPEIVPSRQVLESDQKSSEKLEKPNIPLSQSLPGLVTLAEKGRKPRTVQPHAALPKAFFDEVAPDGKLPAGRTFTAYAVWGSKQLAAGITASDMSKAGSLVAAWRLALPSPASVVFDWKPGTMIVMMEKSLGLVKAGITVDDVTRFVKGRYAETDRNGNQFWRGRLLKFIDHVCADIAIWKAQQTPAAPRRKPPRPDCKLCRGSGVWRREENGVTVANDCPCLGRNE